LMGLDDLAERCVDGGDDESGSDHGSSDGDGNDNRGFHSDEEDESMKYDDNEDPYANLDEDTALALRNDDAEIAALEEKLLGQGNSKKLKKKLNKEFASAFQGYGEDFGDFLDGLDLLGDKIGMGGGDGGDEDGDSMGSNESMDSDDGGGDDRNNDESDDEGSSDSEEDDLPVDTADHDVSLTYRPSSGEDIYGNKIDVSQTGAAKPSKYVPPHLRKKLNQEQAADSVDDVANTDATATPTASTTIIAADPETIRNIQRSLNNSLNRLSDQTLESVSKSIATLYSQYPFHDINDCLWKNIQLACVPPHMIMSGLTPLYIGAMAGVHWLGGDGIQLGGCLVEWSVKKLHDWLVLGRQVKGNQEEEGGQKQDMINKEASNLLLIVCYLYNYGVIHCTLIYDLVRDFIRNFTEIDVEALLIILSHCGQQLRSDDPSALREIVLLVKDRAQKADNDSTTSAVNNGNANNDNIADSSRIQYMVDTIIELKNNKPRKQDAVIRFKTNALKKCIGRIKTAASQLLAGKKSGSCLQVTLQDVLDAETKGRWWRVGASWAGNQQAGKLWDENDTDGQSFHQESNDLGNKNNESYSSSNKTSNEDSLLTLASSQRMNTDARRSIFCIVMGSSDCDDAFEKLVRQGMLKPKAERDVIRVIVHCCGEEKAFNPFYAFLAMRVCEYQAKSRFTLMLTFWDAFKQLETFSVRKVANLAKLLAHLIGLSDGNKCVTIGVLKRIEFSPSDMPEMITVFLSIFMTALFESCDVESIQTIFAHGTTTTDSSSAGKKRHVESESDDDDESSRKVQTTKREDLSDLRESLSVFLLQYMKSSPKNAEGSEFHSNLSAAISTCDETNVAS